MYAIIQDGARQFQVAPGQELDIDYRQLATGEELTFDRVLAYRDDAGLQIGRPALVGQGDGKGPFDSAGAEARDSEVSPPQERAAADRPPPNLHSRVDRQDSGRVVRRVVPAGKQRGVAKQRKFPLEFLPRPSRISLGRERGSAAFLSCAF